MPPAKKAAKKATRNGVTASMVSPHVLVASKPEHVDALRRTWRKTREHYQAQATRFFGIFFGLLGAQIMGNIITGKPALPHFTSWHELQLYLVPLAVVAWRQFHPQLGAKQADSAPGVTIVPNQVAPADAEVDGP